MVYESLMWNDRLPATGQTCRNTSPDAGSASSTCRTAALTITGAVIGVPESKDENAQGFDVPDAVLVTGSLAIERNLRPWSFHRRLGRARGGSQALLVETDPEGR